MKTFQILEKVMNMKTIFDPSWVDGCPGCPGPIINEAIGDYIIAGLLKKVAVKIQTKNIQNTLLEVSKKMAEKSSKGLMAGWEVGDDICPPWWPFPPKVGPRPLPGPWFKIGLHGDVDPDSSPAIIIQEIAGFSEGMKKLMMAGALKQLASLTTDEAFSEKLFLSGQNIVKEASAEIFNEYSGTPPKLRTIPTYQRNS